jgi:hypothetical protein
MESAVAVQENPFGSLPAAARPQENAIAAAEQSRAIAETQAAMVIAKRFPRNQIEAMDRVLQACSRSSLAEAALYEYSRGGSAITGPSIRMAEAIAQAWGNMQFGIRELDQRNGESTVEAFAWDVETNTRQVKVFQVAHKRHTKNGSYPLTDPRDVYEMVANQGARRLRACILGVIPGDVIDAAVKQCEVTLKAKMDITPEFIQSVVEAFAPFGVTKEMLEKRIQRRIDTLTPALAMQLKKIMNSLKDGMSAPGDWFELTTAQEGEASAKASGNAGAKEALKKRGQDVNATSTQDNTTPPPASGSAQPSSSSSTGGAAAAPLFTRKDALKLVSKADYDGARDLLKERGFTDEDRKEVEAAIERHKAGEKV